VLPPPFLANIKNKRGTKQLWYIVHTMCATKKRKKEKKGNKVTIGE
jgi:hypothetical protein